MTWLDWLLAAAILVTGLVIVASVDLYLTTRRLSATEKSRRNSRGE